MSEFADLLPRTRIAYFTMEIALRPEMHTYAGGLGVLAGDTARSCADLSLPVVFVTLINREGYLRQEINGAGSQVVKPDPWTPEDWARPLDAMIALEIGDRAVWVGPWLYLLRSPAGGVVPVLMLDTRLDQNDPEDRGITDSLYGDGDEYRLKQEIVLGIGGVRILNALGFAIETFHMNEGHSALLAASLLCRYPHQFGNKTADGLKFDADRVRERCVFTTHTPVEAGHDKFDYGSVERFVGKILPVDQLRLLGGENHLNMTRLALNLSGFINGVAERHADITRKMFPVFRIREITNGIHVATWAHPAVAKLYDKVAPSWRHEPEELVNADLIENEAIWSAHQGAKEELIAEVKRLTGQELSPDIPLIAFARRMTGYKRPDLLFEDTDRLRRIAKDRPFQVVMAGKAHPNDATGQAIIRELHEHARKLSDDIPMAFLPDYGMSLAKVLVSGADIWLNTPLPPYEASGTSGMKAAVNGGLNLSVLDGWWLEGWIEGDTGWSIGADGSDPKRHARMLYDKLEGTVLPLYYDDRRGWIRMMKEAMGKIGCRFNSQRMMRRYASEAYLK
ncbi:alpha-glucan family phosphorylase [Ostreiculturibacter nitratireducens]|uniref:alpha-glucan family phosphorylase n=1 Tax=Ostreiculturibacter nitratireducens TaxID=3075226 RepID=UPI0031B649FD